MLRSPQKRADGTKRYLVEWNDGQHCDSCPKWSQMPQYDCFLSCYKTGALTWMKVQLKMVGGHHFLFSSSSAAWDSGAEQICVCRWPSGQAKVIFGTFQCRVITSLPLYHDSMLLVRDKRKLRACFLFLKEALIFTYSHQNKKLNHYSLMPFQTSMILYSGTQKEKFY